MQTIIILGRQPALGIAELECLYGHKALTPVGESAVLVDRPAQSIPLARLGGSIKVCDYLSSVPSAQWPLIQETLSKITPGLVAKLPDGKIRLGLSTYGLRMTNKTLQVAGLSLKKAIKHSGKSIRVIPNTAPELNTAQVIHNQLTGPTGIEFVIVRSGGRTLIGRTRQVQDIAAYAARDQKRPKRDARIGMLPPKLAQIIVNLAVASAPGGNAAVTDSQASSIVLDPFCGTGVVLQEATLMGYRVAGSDLDERMVSYTDTNLQWLDSQILRRPASRPQFLVTADATNHTWQPAPDFIACETYLGRAFSTEPAPAVLREVMSDVDTIHRKFLQNVARQTPAGFRLCIAVPAWKTKTGFLHLKMLDRLSDLGYNRIDLVHARQPDLLYYRENQIVARELVILQRTS